MMTTTRSTGRDALIAELMRDYGFKTKRELRACLRTAIAWANEHGVEFGGGTAEFGARPGEDSQLAFVEVADMGIQLHSPDAALSPARRRLLKAALALFLFTHPVTRRQVEAGQCYRVEE